MVLPAAGNLEREEPRFHLLTKGPKATYVDRFVRALPKGYDTRIGETGKLKYFDVPCSRNSRPMMIRKTLSARGDHVARKLSIVDIIFLP